jgi:methionyl-tRNA formyltransferase
VLISQVPPATHGLAGLLRELGHEPVALMCTRQVTDRYGGDLATQVLGAPDELDVVIPARRERMAPLLRPYEPDLLLCLGFPWKIPADALAVPRLGAVNGHPGLLPRYRGPTPVAWAIRRGDSEIGFTFHRMDAELDTGPVLAQGSIPIGDEHTFEEMEPKFVELVSGLLVRALERVEDGDPGDAQPETEAEYLTFFEPEYAWIDLGRSRDDVYRQVRAWRFHQVRDPHGALLERDGETIRVLRVSREPAEGPAIECADGTLWIVEEEAA